MNSITHSGQELVTCRHGWLVGKMNVLHEAEKPFIIPIDAILRKLDNDFFAGRWSTATEREQELLRAIALADLREFGISQVAKITESSNMKKMSIAQVPQSFNSSRLLD